MQVFGPATSPLVTGIGVGTGASAYTNLVNRYTKTLASGSTASLDDQLAAWTNLDSLLLSRDANNQPILYNTNKADHKKATDAYLDSDLAKSLHDFSGRFNAFGFTSRPAPNGEDFNIAQNKLDNLARFSQDDQKKIFFAERLNVPGAYVIGTKDIYYADLDGWKADLTRQAAAFSQQQNATAAASSAVGPAAVSGTASANGTASTAASTLKTARQTAAAATAPATTTAANADIALHLLLTSQAQARSSAAAAHTPTASAHGASAYAASQASSDIPNPSRTDSAWL